MYESRFVALPAAVMAAAIASASPTAAPAAGACFVLREIGAGEVRR